MCMGPVGLAETNSTITRSPFPSLPEPYSGPSCSGEDLAVPLGPQSKVQKTGAGDVYLLEIAPCQVHVVHNGLGNGRGAMCRALAPAIAKEEA